MTKAKKYSGKIYFEGDRGVVRKRANEIYMRSARPDKPWILVKNSGGVETYSTLKGAKLHA